MSSDATTRWRSSRLANLMLTAGSILFSVVLMGVVEIVLRVIGVGTPDASEISRLKYQRIGVPILEPSIRPGGVAVFETRDPRLPYQSILRDKPANALRVFTFGGSATAGLGFSPNVTFARELERMFELAYPSLHVEVVNLGIVALSSWQVKALVKDVVAHYDPDLLIVYSGNNEFLEIHARKYMEAHANLFTRARDELLRTNLYRLVNRAVHRRSATQLLAEQQLSREDLQLSEAELIRDITMTSSDITEVLEAYANNVSAMTEAAAEQGVALVLATVASNWKWRGRSDLPTGWIDEVLEDDIEGLPEERLVHAREKLTYKLRAARLREKHELLFRRASAAEALGDLAAARADYRAAMNDDPHLRRALDAQNVLIQEVVEDGDAVLFDTVEYLGQYAEAGIIGFGEFYDYVHFTPRGAVLVAAGLFDTVLQLGGRPVEAQFRSQDYLAKRLAQLKNLTQDPLDVKDWLGFGFDTVQIADRDLWKYARLLQELDRRIQQRPDDLQALVFRGNFHFFEIDGAADAERDYRAALALDRNHSEVRANLERLLTERRR